MAEETTTTVIAKMAGVLKGASPRQKVLVEKLIECLKISNAAAMWVSADPEAAMLFHKHITGAAPGHDIMGSAALAVNIQQATDYINAYSDALEDAYNEAYSEESERV